MPETQDKKQYFVLKEVRLSAFHILREHSLVFLTPDEAFPLVEAGLILPLYTAIKQKLYPPAPKVSQLKQAIDTLTQKPAQVTIPAQHKSSTNVASSPDESVLVQQLKERTKQHNSKSIVFENQLRKKIQEKKKATRKA